MSESSTVAVVNEMKVAQTKDFAQDQGQPQDRSIELQAAYLIASHPHFRGRGKWLNFRCSDACLQVRGMLPSFYLKQLVQEALRDIGGVKQIENCIQVASPAGELESADSAHSQPAFSEDEARKPR